MKLSFVAAALVTGVFSIGCGDDGPASPDGGADASGLWPELGDYDHPDDFPREGCEAGTMADADVQAVYHSQIDFGDFVSAGAFRIDVNDDGTLGGVISGRDNTIVGRDATDVILRFEDPDNGILRAIDLCKRDADGTMHGTYQTCTQGECYTGTVLGARIDRFDGPVEDGITLLGETNPWPTGWGGLGLSVNVRVADNIAYVARYWDGLRIVDVTDPENLIDLGHVPVEYPESGEIYNDVKLIDGPAGARYALMGSDLAGAVVVDVTTPTAPAIVAHFGQQPMQGQGGQVNVHSIFVDGTRVYLANLDRGVEIYDLTDPTHPTKLGQFRHPDDDGQAFCHDIFVSGDRLYANWWQLGMAIVDVSNPAAPVMIGEFKDYGESSSHASWVLPVGPRMIAVHGDEQWGAHVHIVDVTEGGVDFGNGIGEWETRPSVSVHNIMASGDRAFLSHYQDGVRVLDLSDPTAPTEIAHFDTFPGYDRKYGYNFFEAAVGLDLDPTTNRIYVADSVRGLLVLHLDR